MKNFLKHASITINVILFIIILFMQYCRHCPEQKPCPDCNDSIVVLPGDSIILKGDTVYRPTPADTIYKPITQWQQVDTAKILEDYFASYAYNLKIWDDSNASIMCYVETNKNKVVKYVPSGKITPHNTVTHHYHTIVEPYEEHRKVFLGGGLSYNWYDTAMSAHVSAAYLTKKQQELTLTVDPFLKRVDITTKFLIRFKK